jgi:hypothetical protein
MLLIGLILICGIINPLLAQDNQHRPEDQAIHEQFYETWMMPRNRSTSCCHKMDCAPAEAYFKDGFWWARKVTEPQYEFSKILPTDVEGERDTPDGRSHLCGRRSIGYGLSGFNVYCFIPGTGG